MLKAAVITTDDELFQIHCLNRQNLKEYLDKNIREQEGFVTWLYSLDLLKKMHLLSPGIVVKNGNNVVAYALTTLKEAQIFHGDLEIMFQNLQSVCYKNKPLLFTTSIVWDRFVLQRNTAEKDWSTCFIKSTGKFTVLNMILFLRKYQQAICVH